MHRLRDVSVLALIVAVSIAALKPVHFEMLTAAWQESFWEVLPETAVAAVRVWAFWLVAGGVVGAVLLRLAPGIGLVDTLLAGLVGLWVLAYLAANLLGPLGLFRAWSIWGLLALGVLWLWRAGPPRPVWRRPTTGQALALLAFALVLPPLLLLQLGSPIPPHMDTFAPPASAQRIVTFGVYLPFDNDPFGYWDAASQCPGLEVFYALLALGSGTRLAVLAETAAMVPMAALLVLATYRLGRSLGGDLAGGMAALLLFVTVFFRSFPYGHGRFLAFALTSAGLALFLDRRVHPARLLLGALVLGTAVASHAVIGALAMTIAAAPVLLWLLAGQWRAAVAGVGLLAGATLVALPFVAIGLRLELPYPVLPAVQALGVGLALAGARAMPARVEAEGTVARPIVWALALIVLAVLVAHPNALGSLHDMWVRARYPTLYVGGALGLLCMLWQGAEGRAQVTPIAAGLGVGMLAEWLAGSMWTTFEDPNVGVAVEGFVRKADFWHPYLLVFPAGCLLAELYRAVPRRATLFAVLAVLCFPWRQYADPNYFEHSVVEGWAYHLQLAKGGYWGGTGSRRWAQGEAEFALIDILRDEIAAGRITPATHVVHVTPYVYLYKDAVHFALYTGINDDLYVADYTFDRATAGGRFYQLAKLPAALEARPPYVVVHDVTIDERKLADTLPELPAVLDEYEVLFQRDGLRLLRHPDHASGS